MLVCLSDKSAMHGMDNIDPVQRYLHFPAVTEKKLLIYFTPAFDLNVTYLSLI
jgi:hypothetical protein